MFDYQEYLPWIAGAVLAFAGLWSLLMKYFKRLYSAKDKVVSTIVIVALSFVSTIAVVCTSLMMVYSIYTVVEIVTSMS